MDEITVKAKVENLDSVIEFVNTKLENYNASPRTRLQLETAVEELFVNIASYAYDTDDGTATIKAVVKDDPLAVFVTFIDNGVPYDPLKKKDPDITLSAAERSIGGLGIFMVKKSMDDVSYQYKEGCNILTIKKNI